jgi:hypothetical protein
MQRLQDHAALERSENLTSEDLKEQSLNVTSQISLTYAGNSCVSH